MDTTEDFEFVDEKMSEYFRWGLLISIRFNKQPIGLGISWEKNPALILK